MDNEAGSLMRKPKFIDLEYIAKWKGRVRDGEHLVRSMAAKRMMKIDNEPHGSVKAEVNHGRWLANCPLCGGAEMVSEAWPFIFCMSCGMEDNGSHIMAVEFPKSKRQLEAILAVRPTENRNWTAVESKRDLLAENVAHGIGG